VTPGLAGTLVLMALLGISSGFVAVPLYALLQWRAPADRRGAVIALSNSLTFTGILTGSLIGGALAQAAFNSRAILIWAGLLTFAGTAWAVYLLPEALLRLVLILLTHTFYRLRVHGREHVPQEGGALLTPNHVTFVDALFLIASLDRPVRFIVDDAYFSHWLLQPFMKALRAIPYSAAAGPSVPAHKTCNKFDFPGILLIGPGQPGRVPHAWTPTSETYHCSTGSGCAAFRRP
jgi:acyl-[acyl-carrier-protein]-phospholipid O-acyltransferase/long-chain-fatty-acid--[acyl-carrier-protein] ligase